MKQLSLIDCAVSGCRAGIAPDRVLCLKHWRAVSPDLQWRFWSLYRFRPGTREYLDTLGLVLGAAVGWAPTPTLAPVAEPVPEEARHVA